MKELKCRDMGQDCEFKIKKDETVNVEEEIVKEWEGHAFDAHRLTAADIDHATKEKVKANIKETWL